MDLIEAFRNSAGLFLLASGLFGLVVGSFLNVVILRLPVMLESQWRRDCEEFLNVETTSPPQTFNLMHPRSHCPNCGHQITARENIPILSYLILAGKCKACGTTISLRYPLIEAITAILFIAVAWSFGPEWKTLAGMGIAAALICLTVIDIEHQLLPDTITLPLLWLGLLVNTHDLFTDSLSSLYGAATGYMSLWVTFQLFKAATGKEGMGYGDFKLLALLGAWLGWQLLPMIILLSSLVGACVGLAMMAFAGHDRNKPIPFGPYLAAAGFISMLWGHDMLNTYLIASGLTH